MHPAIRETRVYLCFALIFCLMVFGYGFSLIRLGFLPLTELVLIILLLTFNWGKVGKIFIHNSRLFWPLYLWWVLGFVHLFFSMPVHGIWALRDGSQLIESLFLIVALSMAAMPYFFQRFRDILILVAIAMFITMILLFFPKLLAITPIVHQFALSSAGTHTNVSLLFSLQTTGKLGFFLAMALLIFLAEKQASIVLKVILFFVVTYMFWVTVFVFQMRSVYLEAILLVLWVSIYVRRWALVWLCVLGSFLLTHILTVAKILIIGRISLPVALLSLAMHAGTIVHWIPKHIQYPQYQIKIDTMLHPPKPVKLAFQHKGQNPTDKQGHTNKKTKHLHSINGSQAYNELKGASSGIQLRLGWWKHIWHESIHSWQGILWGQGFGMPLTDFHTSDGIVVRNPHNALFDMMGRMGLLGLLAWLSVQGMFLHAACRLMLLLRQRQDPLKKAVFAVIIAYFLMAIPNFLTEPFFIYPYFCVPYYFFGGVLLWMYLKLLGRER